MTGLRGEPIAIIGSACRFPGDVDSPSKLWEVLCDAPDLRREIPSTRFGTGGFYHRRRAQPGHTYVKHSYVLNDDLQAFDSEFFGIKPIETKAMDPQQRILLETVYEGLEAAGLAIEELSGSDTSVYVGNMSNGYAHLLLQDLDAIPSYAVTGTATSIMSNRISYFFDWHGTSVTIDTACSSSLVGVHMAVQALRSGESRMAVACGSNLLIGPEDYIKESKLNMLSPDGVCKMWDQNANGYARGEGVVSLFLKTMSAAVADGDHIECIIRETGLNQDGATPGLTMPSPSAQQTLIRRTYLKAGLDPWNKPEDRPQYFEAHGTGTPAGDPIEAEAIQLAFSKGDNLSNGTDSQSSPTPLPLYVGSVKTILGHTEGTAGLAGILKVSLALQHGVIPPNLHFRHLSERIAPFYDNLEVVTGTTRPWPKNTGVDQRSRRASVNCFGFGGTNAHVILESYEKAGTQKPTSPLSTPFVFSAGSAESLRANLKSYHNFLTRNPTINARDLAWTLRRRRSLLGYREYFVAASIDDLRCQIAAKVDDNKVPLGVRVSNRNSIRNQPPARIIGIFTGQGAQYARLGAELIERSPRARDIIQSLEADLAALSENHRPSWSLTAELLASSASSRVSEAAIAQPLCTAVQILLVDLLALAGVRLDVVLGHSSGEIAAAYAAGVLSARGAIYVAYLRGLYAGRAASPKGKGTRGAMAAVGMSMADAAKLCDDVAFAGRLAVAASNSSSNVTISGDADAIDELSFRLDEEKMFFRRLRVDMAYHSRHMEPCFDPYVEALRKYDIRALKPAQKLQPRLSKWFSSVYNRAIDVQQEVGLADTYWAENMVRPVLFSQTLRTALDSAGAGHDGLIIEIGPHAALKSPARQNIREVIGKDIPYYATLARGTDAVTAMSTTLGLLWQQQHPHNMTIDLDHYERSMEVVDCHNQPHIHRDRLVKNLPPYKWNHKVKYWAESRVSRRMRLRQEALHPLLGHSTPDSSSHHLRWRHRLSTSDDGQNDDDDEANDGLGWLGGHRIQGQTVFPASGYAATAIEAARALHIARSAENNERGEQSNLMQQLQFIGIHDLVIHQAITLGLDNSEGVEVLIELADINPVVSQGNRIHARFIYSAALGQSDDTLTLVASADLEIVVERKTLDSKLLPVFPPVVPHMIPVESENFYASMKSLGYDYSGMFRSLTGLKRRHGKASCLIATSATCKREEDSDGSTPLLVHPVELDSSLQSLLLAYSYPGDGQLDVLHLPSRIGYIRINVGICETLVKESKNYEGSAIPKENNLVQIDSTITQSNSIGPRLSSQGGFVGDINILAPKTSQLVIQAQGVYFVPLGGPLGNENDRNLFTKTDWVLMAPDGVVAADAVDAHGDITSEEARATRTAIERIVAFYLRQFNAQVPQSSPIRVSPSPENSGDGATAYYLEYVNEVVSSLEEKWKDDTLEDVRELTRSLEAIPDVRTDARIINLVGETMPRVFRGETSMLEQFRQSEVLDDYYVNSFENKPASRWQAELVSQIADRNPHLNMLEIGAGTGGTTKPLLNTLGQRFQSYTFTDVSAGFLGPAATVLSPFKDRLVFRTLDIERDPIPQGFRAGGYDVIIASFVLHATASLSRTLAHVRTLLKPGGLLVVSEGSPSRGDISGFIFGTLPGWWLGRGDAGRRITPLVSAETWDYLLRDAGFSGIDTRSPAGWEDARGLCLFVSQAVDDHIHILRQPLLLSPPSPVVDKMVLIGGRTAHVAQLVENLGLLLRPFANTIHVFKSLADVVYDGIVPEDNTPAVAMLSVVELDKPVFKDMTPVDFSALQRLFNPGRTILWVSSGRLAEQPFSNMAVGFSRTAENETADLCLQHLDIAKPPQEATYTIAETFLRFIAELKPAKDIGDDNSTPWAVESEILVDVDGHYRVPRLLPLQTLNDRYNSGKRHISPEVEITKQPVAIRQGDNDAITFERLPPMAYDESSKQTSSTKPPEEVRIDQLVVPAVRTPAGYQFLARTVNPDQGAPGLALVTSPATAIQVPVTCSISPPSDVLFDATLLSLVAAELVAASIVQPLMPGQSVVVHNAPNSIIRAIISQAEAKSLTIRFIADKELLYCTEEDPVSEVVILSPYLSRNDLWRLLPARDQIACFVSLSSAGYRSKTHDIIAAGLRPCCRKETRDSLFSWEGCDNSPTSNRLVTALLQEAIDFAPQQRIHRPDEPRVLSLKELASSKGEGRTSSNGSKNSSIIRIVDLTLPARVPAMITRLDSRRSLFKPDKTYWLLGLAGDLGVSLCDWTARTGARHIVLSSRSPQIDNRWLEWHHLGGVEVTVIPCDISDYAALSAVHDGLCATHPPIAGIINGAMVLRDTMIRNMTFEQLNDVTRPKVLGSLHLDRLFSDHQQQSALDFFILISSVTCTMSIPGQANYTAANSFLGALATARRRRGLAGLALNVGPIVGAGYMQRSVSSAQDLQVARSGTRRLAESDFHQLIAEAVVAGQPSRDGSKGGGEDSVTEITTSLQSVARDAVERLVWFSDPKFAHLILQQSEGGSSTHASKGGNMGTSTTPNVSLEDRLRACQSWAETEKEVAQAFGAYLRHHLQLTAADAEMMDLTGRQIGLDSLVSVDIRTWFRKTLSINIPLLRIANNTTTIASLVQEAAQRLPSQLKPQIPGNITNGDEHSPTKQNGIL